ncbi:hypothetical protein ACFL2Q_00470 [Thermodesulfobacteriota bacterium]
MMNNPGGSAFMPCIKVLRKVLHGIPAAILAVSVLIVTDCVAQHSQRVPGPSSNPVECSQRESRPCCSVELSCSDKPIFLGYPAGVCFRATCSGIWGLRHARLDQKSLCPKTFTYRHYRFRGDWQLEDQGTIQSDTSPRRELFLVLPGDLVEFKLPRPDRNVGIEVANMGYVKKGSVAELRQWLAKRTYMEYSGLVEVQRERFKQRQRQHRSMPRYHFGSQYAPVLSEIRSIGRAVLWPFLP